VKTIWVSVVCADEVSVDSHATEEDAYDGVRDAWSVPDHIPDDAMHRYMESEYEVEFHIREVSIPEGAL
jgi:hypothetical protein